MSGWQWIMAGVIALTVAVLGADQAAAPPDPAIARPGSHAPSLSPAALERGRLADGAVLHWPHGRLARETSGFDVDSISATSGKAVPVQITLPKDGKPGADGPALVRICGLPPEVTLSAGFRLRDAWVVSLRDVPNLWMSSPAGYDGAFQMKVILQRGGQGISETRIVAVNLGTESARLTRLHPHRLATAAPAAHLSLPEPSLPPPLPPAAPPKPQPSARTEEAVLLERAADILQRGDFEAARMILAELAKRGSALGAFRMAQTYDPRRPKGYFIAGLQPDVEQAKRWYRRAAELGDREATKRLSGLDRRNE